MWWEIVIYWRLKIKFISSLLFNYFKLWNVVGNVNKKNPILAVKLIYELKIDNSGLYFSHLLEYNSFEKKFMYPTLI